MSKHVKALREMANGPWVQPPEQPEALREVADHLERTEKRLRIARKFLRTMGGDAKGIYSYADNAPRAARAALAKMKAVK